MLFRFLRNWLRLGEARERLEKSRQDLKTTATIQREKTSARTGGQDYFLQRDLRAIEEERKREQGQ
jgi:predicted transcriptional regulator